MSKPDFDLLVGWVVDDVKDKFEASIAEAVKTRLELWFSETRDELMKRAAEIARSHRCRRNGCSCFEEIGRDLDEARISG